ncbi:hypothetical protein V6N13_148309 [Hibiscus sabdariffa]
MISHASFSQLQSPMAPPTEGFFVRVFQPYSSMMTAPLYSPGHFFPPPHRLHTSVVPVSLYPMYCPDFSGSNYGMVQHTPTGSLFSADDKDADETEEEEDDGDALIRRNPCRNRHAPGCGTGGYMRH